MTDLTREQVAEYLCIHDSRNPDYIEPEEWEDPLPARDIDCYCASCFRGTDKLANYILHLLDNAT
jgi:hypothetical protein